MGRNANINPYLDAGGAPTNYGGGGGWWTNAVQKMRRFLFGRDRAFKRNGSDSALSLAMVNVSLSSIQAALYQAWIGYMSPLGDIYDLMLASNPIVRGIVRQLKAGVKRVPLQTVPISDDAMAVTIADDVRKQFTNPECPIENCIDAIIECELRGGGLIEVLWKLGADGVWRWTDFVLVPQQRVRFDGSTGEVGFAETVFAMGGRPVSAYPRGTFIAITPDENVPDFSKRGTYRVILSDWFAMQSAAAWWHQDLEFIGSPIVVATYDTNEDMDLLNSAFEEMGSSGRLALRKGATFDLKERQSARGNFGHPHHEFETTRTGRIAIALLGATQTVTVDPAAGSQQSAGVMSGVREDVLTSHWQTILSALRRDLAQVFVALNYGVENVNLTPSLVVDLDTAVDASTLLTAFAQAVALGIPVGKSFARKALKWPEPSKDEETLALAAPAGQVNAPSLPAPQAKPNSPRRVAELVRDRPSLTHGRTQ